MKKSRFSEEQMVKILREADKSPVAQVAKRHGVSEQTIYGWRKRFGKLECSSRDGDSLVELGSGHSRMAGNDDLHQAFHSRSADGLHVAFQQGLEGLRGFHSGYCGATEAGSARSVRGLCATNLGDRIRFSSSSRRRHSSRIKTNILDKRGDIALMGRRRWLLGRRRGPFQS